MEEIYECDSCGNQDYLSAFGWDEELNRYKCPTCGSVAISPVEDDDDEG